MQAGCLQFNPVFCDTEKNIAKIKELTEGKEFELLVMPELANSGYLFSSRSELDLASEEIPDGKFCGFLNELAQKHSAFIISGICEKENDKFYNSSVLVYPGGDIKTYRKTHLFYNEKKWFTPGETGFNVYEIETENSGKVKIGMMICFDWIFPESARTLALKGAQVVCHPSNLVLQYCQKAMFTRAVENRIFTITANRTGTEINSDMELKFTGSSVIVDPTGNYLFTASESGEELGIAEINPELSLNKNVTQMNNVFEDRIPGLYYKD